MLLHCHRDYATGCHHPGYHSDCEVVEKMRPTLAAYCFIIYVLFIFYSILKQQDNYKMAYHVGQLYFT